MESERHRATLALVGEVMGVLELAEFQPALVSALRRAVPSDWVALNGIAPNPGDHWVVMEPQAPADLWNKFQYLAQQNPLIERLQRTQDGRAYRFSDVVSRQELESTELWREVYRPLGVDAQIAVSLPAEPGWILGVVLSRRASNGDFTDAERDLLNEARPFLIQAYRNVLAFEELRGRPTEPLDLADLGLTTRESEILRLVAVGHSNQAAADELQLSVRTVQKHLERAYRKLGVSSRTEAVARIGGR